MTQPTDPRRLHVPLNDAGGVFTTDDLDIQMQAGWFDDLAVFRPLNQPTVNHDDRFVTGPHTQTTADPPPLAGMPFPHTEEGRRRRPPAVFDEDTQEWVTRYNHAPGQAVDIQESTFTQERTIGERRLPYSGEAPTFVPRGTLSRTFTTWDFQYEFELRFTTTQGVFAYTTFEPATAYRQATWRRWRHDVTGWTLFRTEYEQGRLENAWVPGLLESSEAAGLTVHETSQKNGVPRSRITGWYTLSFIEFQQGSGPPPPEAVNNEQWTYSEEVYPHLSDRDNPEWPPSPPELLKRFEALDGAVVVTGQQWRTQPQRLGCPLGASGDPDTLTAWEQVFTQGSWAALRDAPQQRPDGTWDFSRVVVLHEFEGTVTALRPGEVQTISRDIFEAEVLRVPPGDFQEFSPVGLFDNTWPHRWAFATCLNDTRAVMAHHAWRDRRAPTGPHPQNPAQPPWWWWRGRPRRPPRTVPAALPAAPLGLALADVLRGVVNSEPLKRAEPPLTLPSAATRGGVNVRGAVAKRVFDPRCGWLEELDDRTSTAGPLTLTYPLPDVPEGGRRVAALVLRLKGAGDTLTVNGQTLALRKLGHNAPTRRGWHPYTVEVPPETTYTLEFTGKCSRALLCVRVLEQFTDDSGPI